MMSRKKSNNLAARKALAKSPNNISGLKSLEQEQYFEIKSALECQLDKLSHSLKNSTRDDLYDISPNANTINAMVFTVSTHVEEYKFHTHKLPKELSPLIKELKKLKTNLMNKRSSRIRNAIQNLTTYSLSQEAIDTMEIDFKNHPFSGLTYCVHLRTHGTDASEDTIDYKSRAKLVRSIEHQSSAEVDNPNFAISFLNRIFLELFKSNEQKSVIFSTISMSSFSSESSQIIEDILHFPLLYLNSSQLSGLCKTQCNIGPQKRSHKVIVAE